MNVGEHTSDIFHPLILVGDECGVIWRSLPDNAASVVEDSLRKFQVTLMNLLRKWKVDDVIGVAPGHKAQSFLR